MFAIKQTFYSMYSVCLLKKIRTRSTLGNGKFAVKFPIDFCYFELETGDQQMLGSFVPADAKMAPLSGYER